MANAWKNPSLIAKIFAVSLYNNLVLGRLVDARYKNEFVPETGGTVTIRKITRFAGSTGATISSYEDIAEGSTSITIDKRFKVPFTISDEEYALNIKDVQKRVIDPAAKTVASYIEQQIAAAYTEIPMLLGTPGTPISSFSHVSEIASYMDSIAVPSDQRSLVVEPSVAWALAGDLKASYMTDKAKTALERGKVGTYATFDVFSCNALKSHTVGALGGTPLVNGGSQNSTYANVKDTWTQNLVLDGATASVSGWAKEGDVITIDDVYDVNPDTKEKLSNLKEFVVTADANSDASGNVTLVISPPIISSGAFQNVDSTPADNAAITIKTGSGGASYLQNLAFHKNAIALVTVPLQKPDNVWASLAKMGPYSIRIVKDYDIVNSRDLYRVDIFFGVKVVNPELAVRRTS